MKTINDDSLEQITLSTTNNKTIKLPEYTGKPLVLFFYPKDNTPGCTQSVQDFRDFYPSFQASGAEILGVSRDTIKSHENFKKKHELPYELISDHDEKLCQHYDIIKDKNMYGKKVRGIVRSTFLYDAQGNLYKHWSKVKVPGHTEEVLTALNEMLEQ